MVKAEPTALAAGVPKADVANAVPEASAYRLTNNKRFTIPGDESRIAGLVAITQKSALIDSPVLTL